MTVYHLQSIGVETFYLEQVGIAAGISVLRGVSAMVIAHSLEGG